MAISAIPKNIKATSNPKDETNVHPSQKTYSNKTAALKALLLYCIHNHYVTTAIVKTYAEGRGIVFEFGKKPEGKSYWFSGTVKQIYGERSAYLDKGPQPEIIEICVSSLNGKDYLTWESRD